MPASEDQGASGGQHHKEKHSHYERTLPVKNISHPPGSVRNNIDADKAATEKCVRSHLRKFVFKKKSIGADQNRHLSNPSQCSYNLYKRCMLQETEKPSELSKLGVHVYFCYTKMESCREEL